MDNRIERIKELFSDEAMVKEVLSIAEPEKAQEWFSDHGIEFTLDEIKDMGEMINKVQKGEIKAGYLAVNDELSEDDLENVAGGTNQTAVEYALGAIGIAMVSIAIGIACTW
ncbi:hypothetical protein [Butyrivibrio sp.]|jgi:hypothetical protein|uniref:hypothetical protein n=1 Tax=Butyrivibrio sp. TaxID=28121 RepID=UPI0025C45F7A|nr:hypothetical protein [Butyrivibrio sp.]MBE5837539.1 hypothetical protein [Butyrivibrio sp.]MBE5843193.1 hypothetical protein [Butyrivibrio sp.]